MDSVSDPDLRQLLDSARIADSVRSRAGFGALQRHRAEDATLLGLLANLSESGAFVIVTTVNGTERRGVLNIVGVGGVELENSSTRTSLIRTEAIASVRCATTQRLDGDGVAHSTTSWPTFLSSRIEPADVVALQVGSSSISGRVRALSRSLMILDTPDGGVFYAVVDAIDELSVSVPGSMRQD